MHSYLQRLAETASLSSYPELHCGQLHSDGDHPLGTRTTVKVFIEIYCCATSPWICAYGQQHPLFIHSINRRRCLLSSMVFWSSYGEEFSNAFTHLFFCCFEHLFVVNIYLFLCDKMTQVIIVGVA